MSNDPTAPNPAEPVDPDAPADPDAPDVEINVDNGGDDTDE